MCLLPLAPITKKLLVVVPPRLQSTVVALHYIAVETAEFVPLLFGHVTDGFRAHVVVVHVGVVVVHVGVLLPNPRPSVVVVHALERAGECIREGKGWRDTGSGHENRLMYTALAVGESMVPRRRASLHGRAHKA